MTNNWGDLPTDIVAKIAEHIEFYDDYEGFGRICSNWRRAMKEAPHKYINKTQKQLPWLMLIDPDDSSYRRYYSLTKGMFCKIDLPSSVLELDKDDQTRRFYSSHGWLISVTQNNLKVTIFDPFSNNCDPIQLPQVPNEYSDDDDEVEDEDEDYAELYREAYGEDGGPEYIDESELIRNRLATYIYKFAFSTTPSKSEANNGDDFVVALIYGGWRRVVFWRPWQDDWAHVDFNYTLCTDICFFRGEFYGIDNRGKLTAFGDLNEKKTREVFVAQLPDLITSMCFDVLYLVGVEFEYDSYLLVIKRFVTTFEDATKTIYKTTSFKAFRVNIDMGEAQEIKDLGSWAIFVGFNQPFLVQASTNDDEDVLCKANCIYFTDDTLPFSDKKEGRGSDMGIYNLTLDKFVHDQHPYYQGPALVSRNNPPMWIQLSELYFH